MTVDHIEAIGKVLFVHPIKITYLNFTKNIFTWLMTVRMRVGKKVLSRRGVKFLFDLMDMIIMFKFSSFM
jgi:hypothetical protein